MDADQANSHPGSDNQSFTSQLYADASHDANFAMNWQDNQQPNEQQSYQQQNARQEHQLGQYIARLQDDQQRLRRQQQIAEQQLQLLQQQQQQRVQQQHNQQPFSQPDHTLQTSPESYQQVLDLQRYVQQEYARPFDAHRQFQPQQQVTSSPPPGYFFHSIANAVNGYHIPPGSFPSPPPSAFLGDHGSSLAGTSASFENLGNQLDYHSGTPVPTSTGNPSSSFTPFQLSPDQQGDLSVINTEQGGTSSSYGNIQGNNNNNNGDDDEEDAPHETDDEGEWGNDPVNNNQTPHPVPSELNQVEHHGTKRVKTADDENGPSKGPRGRQTAPKRRGRPKKTAAGNDNEPVSRQPAQQGAHSPLSSFSDGFFVHPRVPLNPATPFPPAPGLDSGSLVLPNPQEPQRRIINPERAFRFPPLPADRRQAVQSGRVGPYIDGDWMVRIESQTGDLVRLARRQIRPVSREPGSGPEQAGVVSELEEVWTHPETGQDLRQVRIPTSGRPVMGPDGAFHGFEGSVETAWLFG
ncbi:hypothetical protein SODALDRAFT_380669 [Sodiomyces alkalinus F11]|uniref:Uncharacterized protein n=1 Tax=Sodiomyces alkalinus (strain CBS 110278 / VKM F-3762 / F11) TaxID=1314773 RepID=A0A3N2PPA0_SODAK|nr:hypothetical protein SODALDRAFT_380669 [Sodiomyces alkalinus F11]ROT36341.1 hypothetical protein SODALDRAFT_380669 [Sodiomyces alkalinus F11]